METAMTQIKINLPVALKKKIKARADKWGLSLATYIKYMIVNKVEEEYPTFEASDRVKKIIRDIESGREKTIPIDNLNKYFAKISK
jgi:predicted DNA-binding protein